TALYLPGSDRVGERYNEIRIIVTWVHGVRPEIDHLVSRLTKMSDQLFLQIESTVISGNSNMHIALLSVHSAQKAFGSPFCVCSEPINCSAAARSASTRACSVPPCDRTNNQLFTPPRRRRVPAI